MILIRNILNFKFQIYKLWNLKLVDMLISEIENAILSHFFQGFDS